MRFMAIVKANRDWEAGVMPSTESLAAMDKFNEELVKAGVMLASEGLYPSSRGVRIRFRDRQRTVIDGPFAQTEELIAGFWLLQVRSKEEAIEWLKRAPFNGGEEVELRPVFEAEVLAAALSVALPAEEERRPAQAANPPATKIANKDARPIQAYLFFEGRCEEALGYYRDALGAEIKVLMRCCDSPQPWPAGTLPTGSENKVMHAEFRIGGTTLLASDGFCSGDAGFHGFSLSLPAADGTEAKRLFEALADGGAVSMPLRPTFFATSFGMVTDRFGIDWMVVVRR
jgi:PhnB protein